MRLVFRLPARYARHKEVSQVAEWTWLHAVFPVADIELIQSPIEPQIANVLVRTVRVVPGTEDQYDVRVAPHNVAPFRGGPWLHRFSQKALLEPGDELIAFRTALAEQIRIAPRR